MISPTKARRNSEIILENEELPISPSRFVVLMEAGTEEKDTTGKNAIVERAETPDHDLIKEQTADSNKENIFEEGEIEQVSVELGQEERATRRTRPCPSTSLNKQGIDSFAPSTKVLPPSASSKRRHPKEK